MRFFTRQSRANCCTLGGGRAAAESGQVTVLAAVVVVVAAVLMVVGAALGRVVIDHARAQTAADAAALAGASIDSSTEFTELTERVARANGAERVVVGRVGNQIEVEVEIGRQSASAAAMAGTSELRDLAPVLHAALARARQLAATEIVVVAGWHDGEPWHNAGLAIDVAPEHVNALQSVAATVGLCQPRPVLEPAHFQWCG